MNTEVTKVNSLPDNTIQLPNIIEFVQNKDLTPDALEKFINLYERLEQKQARSQFVKALGRFKALCPVIEKKRKVSFNQTKYDYASLEDIYEQTRQPLAECGLTYTFNNHQDGNKITVTCVLEHEGGFSRETPITCTPDDSGKKNTHQALGSSLTYLKRYALLGALGIAVADEDDDAHSANDNAGKVRIISAQKQKAVDEWLQTYGRDWAQLHKILPKIIGRNVAFLEELAEDECDKIICFIQERINKLEGKQ